VLWVKEGGDGGYDEQCEQVQVVTCRVLVGFWEKARGNGLGLATGLKF